MSAPEKAILPTKRAVLRELNLEIDSWRTCNTESDGEIRDVNVWRSIRCLEAAVRMVRAYRPKQKQRRTS